MNKSFHFSLFPQIKFYFKVKKIPWNLKHLQMTKVTLKNNSNSVQPIAYNTIVSIIKLQSWQKKNFHWKWQCADKGRARKWRARESKEHYQLPPKERFMLKWHFYPSKQQEIRNNSDRCAKINNENEWICRIIVFQCCLVLSSDRIIELIYWKVE